VGIRSIAFEVLAVTQFTPHCVRNSLLAEEDGRCELTSGQELSLSDDGADGVPYLWIWGRSIRPRNTSLLGPSWHPALSKLAALGRGSSQVRSLWGVRHGALSARSGTVAPVRRVRTYVTP
jgi:hypothetical protein